MFWRISSILFILLFATAFTHTATIENSGENRYKAIRLTPEVYNNANRNLSDLRITDASGEYVPFFIHSDNFVESFIPDFRTEEEGRFTHIHIEGLKHLRLSEIIIDTDSMFRRTVEARSFNIRRELYNLPLGDEVSRDTSMLLEGNISWDDIFTLIIHNGDDRPINITGITVIYYADELIFENNDSAIFTLHFGAGSSVQAPVYDIARFSDEILRLDIDRLEIGRIVFEEIQPEPEPEPRDFRMIFNIVVIAVAVLLGLLILLKLRKSV